MDQNKQIPYQSPIIPNQDNTKDILKKSQFGVSPVQAHVHGGPDSIPLSHIGDLVILKDSSNGMTAGSFATNHTLFLNDQQHGNYRVTSVSVIYGNNSISGNGSLNISVSSGTQSSSQGTNQLSPWISLAANINVPIYGTLRTDTTRILAGNRVNVVFTQGISPTLSDCCVTVILEKVR